MADQQRSAGVQQAMLAKLEQQVLPKTLGIKRRVDAGERLTEHDMAFLDGVLKGLGRDQQKVEDNPQWSKLYTRLIDLYHEITRTALENEQRE